MAARPEALARIAARIREETVSLERTAGALREALGRWGLEAQDVITVHWVGGLLHDLYTGLERIFQEISPELNGQEPQRDAWHRDLLHAMTLDLQGFRPRVVRPELERPLLELLKFRHLYRNLYSFELRWDRVRDLGESAAGLWPTVRADLESFAAALDAMARA